MNLRDSQLKSHVPSFTISKSCLIQSKVLDKLVSIAGPLWLLFYFKKIELKTEYV